MTATVLVTDSDQMIPIEDIKAHCRLTNTDLDDQLGSFADAAADWVESYTGRPARLRVFDYVIDYFDLYEICLPRAPVVSITPANFTYVDVNGTVTQVPTAFYTADTDSTPGRVVRAYNQWWPLTRPQINAVRIRFTAGYATIQDLPERMRQASLLFIQNQLDSGGSDDKMTAAAQSLLWPLRISQ